MNSRGRGRSRAKPHARRGIGRPACRRCAARRRRRSNQYIRLPTTTTYRGGASTCATPRRPGKRARSRRPPRLADTEGSLSPRWQQAGTCQPARQEAAAHAVGPVAGRGQAASGNRLAGRRRPKYPSTYVDPRSPSGVATKPEKEILFTSWELKGRRSNSQ